MGFFDIFKKKSDLADESSNECYKGFNSFNYVYDDTLSDSRVKRTISLKIIKKLDLGEYSNLYECNVRYGSIGVSVSDKQSDDLCSFDGLIIGFDRDKMINDFEYDQFVFTNLLNVDRIKKLHDIEVGLVEGKKHGNYVGTVLEKNDNLSIFMDDNLGDIIRLTSKVKSVHDLYEKYKEDEKNSEVNIDEGSSLNRDERIKNLKEELRELAAEEKNYESSKNK